jgi:hypothetical protein
VKELKTLHGEKKDKTNNTPPQNNNITEKTNKKIVHVFQEKNALIFSNR